MSSQLLQSRFPIFFIKLWFNVNKIIKRNVLFDFLFAFITIVLFQGYRVLLLCIDYYPIALLPSLVVVIAFCSVFSFINFDEITASLKVLIRGLAVACGIYNILLFPSVPIVENDFNGLAQAILFFAWATAALSAILAMWRPSWLFICGFYPFWLKSFAGQITGFHYHTQLDILPVHQIPAYVSISVIFFHLMLIYGRRNSNVRHLNTQSLQIYKVDANNIILFIAIAFQGANYFYSGIEKASLDGGYLHWALNNEIQNIFFVALYNKQLLWGESKNLVTFVADLFSYVSHPAPIFIFIIQLGALFVFTNRLLLIILFSLFDVLHFGIFALVGANFVTWFMVNLVIIAAVNKLPCSTFNWKLGIVGAILILISPFYAKVAKLGWYDSLAVNSAYFEVLENNGRRTRIPGTAFGFYSYPITHMSFGFPPGNYLPTSTNGGTRSNRIREQSIQCDFDTQQSMFSKRWNENVIVNFIKSFHKQILDNVGEDGRWSNDLYLHHFWSAPSVVKNFESVDMRSVNKYILVIDSVCLEPGTGNVAHKPYYNEFRINVNK
ncbi:MAG: hypothetical protein KJ725_01450 [Gammaproteobacteria bacterium]|nr:hypothetical protein [Gammaproteobacteria bacterium]